MSSANNWGTEASEVADEWNDESMLDVEFDDVDPSEVGSGAPKVDRVGWYHFLIESKSRLLPYEKDDMSKHRRPDVLCVCHVLHSSPGQSPEGSTYYHSVVLAGKGPSVPIDQWDRKKMLNFLVGVGLLKKVDGKIIDPATGTSRIDAKSLATRLNGMQFIGKIELSTGNVDAQGKKYDDKHELPWGRGAYQLDDPVVKEIPKNAEWAAKVAKPQSQTVTEAKRTAKSAQAAAAVAADL